MPAIRNSTLIKKFTDFFQLKHTDMLDSEAGRMLVPVITHPILPKLVYLRPTEAQLDNGDVVVPSGKKWRIKNVHLVWTSDANAGNRSILLEATDPAGADQFDVRAIAFQTASKAVRYEFYHGAPHTESANELSQNIPIPDMQLREGTTFFLVDESGVAAGDTVTGAVFIVEESDVLEDEIEDRAV